MLAKQLKGRNITRMAGEVNRINIQFGRTDGFRYIGIQPPLTDEQVESLLVASQEDRAIPSSWGLRKPHNGHPHSEIGYMSHIGDERLVHVAELIAGVLTNEGTTVHIDKTIQDIGYGRFLFDGEAERLG